MRLPITDVFALLLLLIGITGVILGPFHYNKKLLEDDGKVFVVTVHQWGFEPKKIVVKRGDKITLHFKSNDVTHGIYSTTFGINEIVYPGKVTKVSFIANRSGTFVFRCIVYCGEFNPPFGEGHWSMKFIVEVVE